MSDKYLAKRLAELRAEGADEEYIEDFEYLYENTGLDLRDLTDDTDVYELVEYLKEGDLDSLLFGY